jgi:ATPase subunit of ABC transporter with duplicated ATPase domains
VLSVKGNYSQFLMAREEQLSAQANLQQALASQVRREVAWLQQVQAEHGQLLVFDIVCL